MGEWGFLEAGRAKASLELSKEYRSSMNSALIKATTPTPTKTLSESPTTTEKQSIAKYFLSPWALTIATCLLLATSGGIRFWRDHQFRVIARENENCPFAMDKFPKVLGTWYMDETAEARKLDPEIARIAGANSYFIRTYIDKKTHEKVLVLLLYGSAESVFGHNPEICYPASGYKPIGPPAQDHEFRDDSVSPLPIRFRSAFFTKTVGAITRYEEVYYTFYHNHEWLTELASRWKSFRYHPGMLKLLLQRETTSLSTENSPTEALLKEIVREVGLRSAQS